jgi:hypothetical protein
MSVARFVIFIVVVTAALAAINVHVFRWARKVFGLQSRGQLILKGVLWASIAGVVLGRLAGRFWPGSLTTGLIAISSTIQLAVIISCDYLKVVDAALFVLALPARLRRLRAPVPAVAVAACKLRIPDRWQQRALRRAQRPA